MHLSCSDKFPGGWGEKDGPEQGVDTAWQIASWQIQKLKDGELDKTCGNIVDPNVKPDGNNYSFTFVNGVIIDGNSDNNTAFLPNAGGPSADNPTGMDVHVSCSDKFPGGWGEKDGPDQNVDTAWQIESYSIMKFKDGKLDKSCGDSFAPPPPVGDPAIDIEKYVNGDDADTPTGPSVNIGDTVTFDYVVTNTGEIPLFDVVAVDQTLGPITCPKTELEPGEAMDCTPNTEMVIEVGQMFMEADVTGMAMVAGPGVPLPLPNGDGKAYSFTFVNGITITGSGQDNTEFLPNAGGTSVDNPTGMDVHISCSDKFPGGWGEKDGPEQGVDTAWQIASYEIIKFKDGKVDKRCGEASGPVKKTVTDTDPVYFIAVDPGTPSIDVEKYVNGHDADTPPGPTFTVGDTVTFTYVVTNTGNTPLSNVEVIDSTLGRSPANRQPRPRRRRQLSPPEDDPASRAHVHGSPVTGERPERPSTGPTGQLHRRGTSQPGHRHREVRQRLRRRQPTRADLHRWRHCHIHLLSQSDRFHPGTGHLPNQQPRPRRHHQLRPQHRSHPASRAHVHGSHRHR